MNPFKLEEIANILETIYQYSKETLKDIRERLNYSRVKFSREYNIPIRTIENWDTRNNLTEYTEILIKYTLFIEEVNKDYERIIEK